MVGEPHHTTQLSFCSCAALLMAALAVGTLPKPEKGISLTARERRQSSPPHTLFFPSPTLISRRVCCILKVKNIKFSSAPPLIFLQHQQQLSELSIRNTVCSFFACLVFCTLYLLNFSPLILHCIFFALPPLTLKGKTFSTQCWIKTGEEWGGSSTPC